MKTRMRGGQAALWVKLFSRLEKRRGAGAELLAQVGFLGFGGKLVTAPINFSRKRTTRS